MIRTMLESKNHRATVTEANVEWEARRIFGDEANRIRA